MELHVFKIFFLAYFFLSTPRHQTRHFVSDYNRGNVHGKHASKSPSFPFKLPHLPVLLYFHVMIVSNMSRTKKIPLMEQNPQVENNKKTIRNKPLITLFWQANCLLMWGCEVWSDIRSKMFYTMEHWCIKSAKKQLF